MAGFWTGFMDAHNRAMDRDERWKLFTQEQQEKRYNTLLSLAQKRRAAQAEAEDYSGEFNWVKNRLGEVEGGDEFLAQLATNPSNAAVIKETVEKAEQKLSESGVDRRITGTNFLETFEIVGDRLDDPEYRESFINTGGDAVESLLRMSPEDIDDETYGDLFSDLTSGVSRSDSRVSVDINRSGLVVPNTGRAEKAKELLDTTLVDSANVRIREMQENGMTSEAAELTRLRDSFVDGKDTRLRSSPIGIKTYETVVGANPDMFGPLAGNPYLEGWRKDTEAVGGSERGSVEPEMFPDGGTASVEPTTTPEAPPVPEAAPIPEAVQVDTPSVAPPMSFNSDAEARRAITAGRLKTGDSFTLNGKTYKVD